MSDFDIHQQSTSHGPGAGPASRRGEPGCVPGSRPGAGSVPTCLMGMARPLPMLSARPSRPFFSLSGSLPFRDCKTKTKLALGKGCGPQTAEGRPRRHGARRRGLGGRGECLCGRAHARTPQELTAELLVPTDLSSYGGSSKLFPLLFHCKITSGFFLRESKNSITRNQWTI